MAHFIALNDWELMLATVTSLKSLLICSFSSALIEISVLFSWLLKYSQFENEGLSFFYFRLRSSLVVYMLQLEIQREDQRVEKK